MLDFKVVKPMDLWLKSNISEEHTFSIFNSEYWVHLQGRKRKQFFSPKRWQLLKCQRGATIRKIHISVLAKIRTLNLIAVMSVWIVIPLLLIHSVNMFVHTVELHQNLLPTAGSARTLFNSNASYAALTIEQDSAPFNRRTTRSAFTVHLYGNVDPSLINIYNGAAVCYKLCYIYLSVSAVLVPSFYFIT